MSHVKRERNRKIAPKDQFELSLNDEGSCSGSSLAGGTVLKKGPWTSLEDAVLVDYVRKHGEGNWNTVQKSTGLSRCGKSCRLRWTNHLRPNLKKGAFNQEEEKMIIQLHSKLGNKWAQIAAMLPGRTDNEIKNYWNTRIKRQQRAGVPLYPQHGLLQDSNENQQTLNDSMYNSGDKNGGKVLQGHMSGLLSHSSPFPDISLTGLQNQDLGSHTYSFNRGMNHAKQLRESESYFPGNHGSMANGLRMFEQLPHGPDPVNKNLLSLGYSKPGSLIQPNGNFSTSMPLTGTVKLELPSLQCPGTDCFYWLACPPAPPHEAIHTYIQSPPVAASTQSDCASQSSGLLETLVQGSHAISTVRKQSSEMSSNYSAFSPSDMLENSTVNMCSADWEGSSDPNSPFCRSAASPFSECAPISSSSLYELPDSKGPLGLEIAEPSAEQISTPNVVEKDISLDFLRPDALLGSGWYTEASGEPQ